MFPVRYQPGGGSPNVVAWITGKSAGRQRIQYCDLPPTPSVAAMTAAWLSARSTVSSREGLGSVTTGATAGAKA